MRRVLQTCGRCDGVGCACGVRKISRQRQTARMSGRAHQSRRPNAATSLSRLPGTVVSKKSVYAFLCYLTASHDEPNTYVALYSCFLFITVYSYSSQANHILTTRLKFDFVLVITYTTLMYFDSVFNLLDTIVNVDLRANLTELIIWSASSNADAA